MTQEELQKLFERYNRKYWRAQLPRYTVVISTRWHGGYCAKRLRVIFIHPDIAADDWRKAYSAARNVSRFRTQRPWETLESGDAATQEAGSADS